MKVECAIVSGGDRSLRQSPLPLQKTRRSNLDDAFITTFLYNCHGCLSLVILSIGSKLPAHHVVVDYSCAGNSHLDRCVDNRLRTRGRICLVAVRCL